MLPDAGISTQVREALDLLTNTSDLESPVPAQVRACLEQLACPVPLSYLEFLHAVPYVNLPRLTLNGIGREDLPSFSVLDAQRVACSIQADAARLIPLRVRDDGYWICIDMTCLGECPDAPVRVFELDAPSGMTPIATLADGFAPWLLEQARAWFANTEIIRQSADRFRRHVETAEADGSIQHDGTGRPPKAHEWNARVARTQDVRQGQWVWRLDRMNDLIEIDVFMAADVPELRPLETTRGILCYLGAEAFRLGDDVGLRFTSGELPASVGALCAEHGIEPSAGSGVLTREEISALMLSMANLSPDTLSAAPDNVAAEWLVQLVREGVWSASEITALSATECPLSVLLACDFKTGRATASFGCSIARPIVSLGLYERRLQARVPEPGEEPSLLDDTERLVEATTGEPEDVWAFRAHEDMTVPWATERRVLEAGRPLTVWSVAPTPSQYPHVLTKPLSAERLASFVEAAHGLPALLLPSDVAFLDSDVQAEVEHRALDAEVTLLIGPLNQRALDDEYFARGFLSRRSLRTWE